MDALATSDKIFQPNDNRCLSGGIFIDPAQWFWPDCGKNVLVRQITVLFLYIRLYNLRVLSTESARFQAVTDRPF